MIHLALPSDRIVCVCVCVCVCVRVCVVGDMQAGPCRRARAWN